MLKNYNKRGFTVIELLVVIAITVILIELALPSFITFGQRFRITATAQSLYYALQQARTEAIKRNQSVYVNFNTTDPWCYGMNNASACNCATNSPACSLGITTAPRTQDMTMTTSGLSSNSLQFENTRGALNNGKTIITFTIYGGTTAMSVEVTALGNMFLCSSTISGYPACT